jgi:hypothetical protein
MKAGIIVTGTGPMVVLTSFESFEDPEFSEKLAIKGVRKFIAYEIPLTLCRERYGEHYSVVMEDLRQTDDLRVLDFDGHHVYATFAFEEYGPEYRHELSERTTAV